MTRKIAAHGPLGSYDSTVPGRAPAASRRHQPRRAPGEKRDWAAVNAALVARGDVTVLLDPAVFTHPHSGRGGGYSPAAIETMCALAAVFGLPLRQTEGFTRSLLHLAGVEVTGRVVPDYSTLCRRRRRASFTPPPASGPVVLAIDGTGVTVCSPGEWTRHKYGDRRRAKYVKLHVGVDVATGQFRAAVVTDSTGPGSGDVSCGPALIEAVAAGGPIDVVLADQAYDAKTCWAAAADAGGVLVCVPKDNAVRGLHPDRDTVLTQIGRIGETRWRERVGYGDRAHVEGAFSALKRTLGHRTRATSLAGAAAEILTRVAVYNTWREHELAAAAA